MLDKIVLTIMTLVLSIVSVSAQTVDRDSLSMLVLTDHPIQHKSVPRFTLRQTIAPLCLFGAAGLTSFADKEIKRFRDDKLFDYDNRLDDIVQVSPGVLLYVLRFAGVEGESKSLGQLVSATLFSAVITAGVTEGLKNTCGRRRPYDEYAYNSFPSGHTFSAFTSATLLYREYRNRNKWIGVGGYGVASAVGISRVLNRQHWTSDVLAGAGLGVISGNLGYALAKNIYEGREDRRLSWLGRKPSFLGISAIVAPWGNDIRGLGNSDYEQTAEKDFVAFDHKCGYGYSIEGAYFFNKYFGLGCETTLIMNKFEIDERKFRSEQNPLQQYFVSFDSNTAKTYLFTPGVYLSYPLCDRLRVSGKVLCGIGETQSMNVNTVFRNEEIEYFSKYLFDQNTYGIAVKTGVGLSGMISRCFELNIGLSYGTTYAGYEFFQFPHCEDRVSNLMIQAGVAVSFD